MDDGGNTREDLKLPDNELGKEIEKRFDNGETFMVSFYGLRVENKKKKKIFLPAVAELE